MQSPLWQTSQSQVIGSSTFTFLKSTYSECFNKIISGFLIPFGIIPPIGINLTL